MKRLLLLTLLSLVAACGPGATFHQNGGWTYLNAPGLQPTLLYAFDPAPGQFSGTCDTNPAFLAMGGDRKGAIKTFTVTTGKQGMTFDNYMPGSAKALAMLPRGETGGAAETAHQRQLEAMLSGTTAPITITTDTGWTRTVPASPEIGKFVAACHAWRKDHPAAG